MFDVKPLERSMEFRDRIKQRDPEMLERYEQHLEQKRQWYTSINGFYQSLFERLKLYAHQKLQENEGFFMSNDAGFISSIWVGHRQQYGIVDGRTPESSPLAEINQVRTFDDLIGFYIKCHEKDMEADDPLIGWNLGVEMGFDTNEETYSDRNHHPKAFYREQFRRLERENLIGTVTSEEIFLPLLSYLRHEDIRMLWADYGDSDLDMPNEAYRDPEGNIPSGIHRQILLYTSASFPISFDELQEQFEIYVEDERSDPFGYPEDVRESMKGHMEKLFSQGKAFLEREKTKTGIIYGTEPHELLTNMPGILYNVGRDYVFDISWEDVEKRLKRLNSIFEEQASKDPEKAIEIREQFLNERLALYLFKLYRRYRRDHEADIKDMDDDIDPYGFETDEDEY